MSTGRLAVFDCFSGIAGDMCLAALADAGADLDAVRADLARLKLPAFSFVTERVQRAGMEALHLRVAVEEERQYQPAEMRDRIGGANYPARVRTRALAAIDALAAGEAAAHRTSDVHFHEVGGVDALVDITGAMLALEQLDVAAAWCPVVTVGSGTIVRSSHGAIPAAPGPAAAAILQDAHFTLRFVESAHELVTPTGAAILAAVAQPGPATLRTATVGAGAGTHDPRSRPNALRIFLGEGEAATTRLRELSVLEANIDDMAPTLLADARDQLMAEGAADAWFEPIAMKKGRPANKLCVLVPREREAHFANLMLRETTTIGVRVSHVHRYEAERHVEEVVTSFGPVRVKTSSWQGRNRRAPEFEDVRIIARRLKRPLLDVQRQIETELRSERA